MRLQDLHLGGHEVTRERSLEVTSMLLNLHFETKLDSLRLSVFLSDLSGLISDLLFGSMLGQQSQGYNRGRIEMTNIISNLNSK